jgi:hypothetical protein
MTQLKALSPHQEMQLAFVGWPQNDTPYSNSGTHFVPVGSWDRNPNDGSAWTVHVGQRIVVPETGPYIVTASAAILTSGSPLSIKAVVQRLNAGGGFISEIAVMEDQPYNSPGIYEQQAASCIEPMNAEEQLAMVLIHFGGSGTPYMQAPDIYSRTHIGLIKVAQ